MGILPGATLTVAGAGLLTLNTALAQDGTIAVTAGASLFVNGTYVMGASGVATLGMGSLLQYTGTTDMSVDGQIMMAGATITTLGGGGLHLNGTFTTTTGLDTFNGNFAVGGGTLQFTGPLHSFTIVGNYDQFVVGQLSMRIAPGASSDSIVVSGNATLNGILTVTAMGTPTPGAAYNLMQAYTSMSGGFSITNLPPELAGTLQIVYLPPVGPYNLILM
jgi:hypothetical protein